MAPVAMAFLLPAFNSEAQNPEALRKKCAREVGVDPSAVECYHLTKVSPEQAFSTNMAFMIKQDVCHPAALTTAKLDEVLLQNNRYYNDLQRLGEALETQLSSHIEKDKTISSLQATLKKQNGDLSGRAAASNDQSGGQKGMAYWKDLSQLQEMEINVLRKQLKKSDDMRKEIQGTLETLKREFELLTKDILAGQRSKSTLDVPAKRVYSKSVGDARALKNRDGGGFNLSIPISKQSSSGSSPKRSPRKSAGYGGANTMR